MTERIATDPKVVAKVIALRGKGHSLAKVAAATGLSRNTVASLLRRRGVAAPAVVRETADGRPQASASAKRSKAPAAPAPVETSTANVEETFHLETITRGSGIAVVMGREATRKELDDKLARKSITRREYNRALRSPYPEYIARLKASMAKARQHKAG